MTRKDFEFFATVFAKAKLDWQTQEDIVSYFEERNEKFDRDRFFRRVDSLQREYTAAGSVL